MSRTQDLIRTLGELSEESSAKAEKAESDYIRGWFEGRAGAYLLCASWVYLTLSIDGLLVEENDEGLEEGEEEEGKVEEGVES